ncbi:protein-glutamate methylesterase/protein-glutamine glutaminase [Sneathiella chinensis]|uniref:Protein-glutamate methylesterase/protein-glutamine glutaminase n=1 Tax=Sneathiella chinensis TaxID=349750 RepID=A0ABQ5U0W0_9PROT|nr:chemotaxis response regulator protein-glutamate methylesterase [Sneathiella chinensis]GLQ05837.1 chemotaxis response regulator protein-glutamate methylesterase 1 [Sneathiella chinensis]
MNSPYRVMVVDDSAVIRGFLTRWLQSEPDIEVVASASNGVFALREFDRTRPEIVVLDIEMPEMDGMTALPKLIEMDRNVKVIMASTLTRRNADISMKALANGAADYIPKPESTREASTRETFQKDLVAKIKALGLARRRQGGGFSTVAPAPKVAPSPQVAAPQVRKTGLYQKAEIVLRKSRPTLMPQALAIGSSTGGPQALFSVFEKLRGHISVPVFITQHMPATFTTILSEHLTKIYGKTCAEAVDGEKVVNDRVYLAPGDFHMTVEKKGGDVVLRLDQNPPENFCRPAVDPMLRSLHAVYGSRVLTVILTGMGHDGLKGCELIAESGGYLIGQDEASSVVWGMPGAVATAGLCNSVLPLQDIPAAIENALKGRPL